MDLKRRGFLAAGVSAVAIATLPSGGAAQQAAEAGERYPIGDFILDARRGRLAHIAQAQARARHLGKRAGGQFHRRRAGEGDHQGIRRP